MRPLEPAGRPAGGTDDEANAATGNAAANAAGYAGGDEPAAGPVLSGTGPTGMAPVAPGEPGGVLDAQAAADAAGEGVAGTVETGFGASTWAGIELPPTATSRRRRKRGHRGGVGRRGGRRIAQPNPEDDPLYPFKVQAAQELGLWPKVEAEGWGALTSLESGRIGGYMQRLVKEAIEEGRISAEEAQRLLQQRRIRPASTET